MAVLDVVKMQGSEYDKKYVFRKEWDDLGLLGPSWGVSWSLLGRLGGLLALLEAILGRLGALLGLSRGVLEASWAVWQPS